MHTHELQVPVQPPLGATLTIPENPRVAALMHQGSGVHDRDGNMQAVGFKSTLYRRVARELAKRAGVATLRFDKRGHDKPAEYPHTYTLQQRLDDAGAALNVLREHEQTRDLPLYLIGHSEGAMVVAKLAESEDVKGVVSLAAPFGNVFELGKERARRMAEEGKGQAKARGELALEYYARLEQHFKEGAKFTPEDFVEFAKPYQDAGYAGWESCEWLAGHWAEALKSDPTRHDIPMLVVQGGRDARLWPDNPKRWQAWCEDRPLADYRLIDHMGHDLNDARQKLFRVDDKVLDITSQWLSGT
jgi:uncharacterized protein